MEKNKKQEAVIDITDQVTPHQTIIKAPTPADLLQMAINKDADLDKLERLMEMHGKWEAKEAAKAFKMAMADFQANKPELKKTKKASFTTQKGHTEYFYSSLAGIQQAVDPVLSKFGLSYRWSQKQDADSVTITCIVSHIDGHTESNSMTAIHDASGSKNAIQAIGSTVSYLKRYTLEGAIGLSTDRDDDANGAGANRKKELQPGSPEWANVVKALQGDYTIEQVEAKYYISPENRDKLLDAGI